MLLYWYENYQWPCFFKKLTGVDCPGCGFQRSLMLLIQGKFTASFFMYPPLIGILLTFLLLVVTAVRKSKKNQLMIQYGFAICAGFIMASYVVKLFFI
jgi:hypothetical protein